MTFSALGHMLCRGLRIPNTLSCSHHARQCYRVPFHCASFCTFPGSQTASGPKSTTSFDENSRLYPSARRDRLPLKSGQPTHLTHPHLLGPNEVTAGITADEYRDRRAKLLRMLCQREGRHHVLILHAAPRLYMVDKIPHHYRQNSDFLWCTGCLETDCVLVLHTVTPTLALNNDTYKAVMFCAVQQPSQELWDGPRTHYLDAPAVWGVDEGKPLTELVSYLTSLERSLSSPSIWYEHTEPVQSETRSALQCWLNEGSRRAGLEAPKSFIHRARLIKSPAEQELMRQTCRLSGQALATCMSWTRPGLTEHQLFARMEYECRLRGASQLAYPPVVAGGNRANVVHNIRNDQVLCDGDLVLMDAGSELHGYSGDVTRTWPVNGRFSTAQRELYEAVLHVQQQVLSTLREERPCLDRLYKKMCHSLAALLPQLGIVSRDCSSEQRMMMAMALCPHHVSHYLGMDVHDTATVPHSDPIQTGSVITVEPGIYVPLGCQSVPERFHGIGIRIEDDVLLTDTGYEILSDNCPKHPDDVEAHMRLHGERL